MSTSVDAALPTSPAVVMCKALRPSETCLPYPRLVDGNGAKVNPLAPANSATSHRLHRKPIVHHFKLVSELIVRTEVSPPRIQAKMMPRLHVLHVVPIFPTSSRGPSSVGQQNTTSGPEAGTPPKKVSELEGRPQ